MIFNLIPIPPLDGSKLLFLLLPDSMNNVRDFLQQYGFYILIAFLLFGASLFARLSVFIEAVIYYVFVPPM
jgi:Zn-dependent protease